MSLKKGGGPKTLLCTLTILGQDATDKVNVTYHNRKTSEVNARLEIPGARVAGIVPYIVESWDLEYDLTEEGVIELEDEHPGMIDALIQGFWKARRRELEKN